MNTRFADLVRHGVPQRMTAILEADFGPALLPLQEQVIEQTGVLERAESVLVSSPTASGKTLIAELAALVRIARSRIVLYLVPTRALAEEKAAEFSRRWSPLGVRVACSTRDRREDDEAILRGEIHLTVAVYEKAFGLFFSQATLLARLGLIVADEIQLLGDMERGAAIDMFLTRWIEAETKPQLLALSAVLGNAEAIAAWLGIRHFHSELRPVPLREGLLNAATGLFRWRNQQTGESGEESLLPPVSRADETENRFLGAVADLAAVAPPLMLFCATKREAVSAAGKLSEMRRFKGCDSAIHEIEELPSDLSRERLLDFLPQGVGLHTADMPARHRRCVEHAFQSGQLAVLVATPTLDQGVNLVAATVVHSPWMIARDSFSGENALVALSRSRFLNQGGRAGRSGMAFGRSIVLVSNELEEERLWTSLISSPLDSVRSPLGCAPLLLPIAQLLGGRPGLSEQEIASKLNRTFGGRLRGREIIESRVRSDLKGGEADGVWAQQPGGKYSLTGLGEVVALSGVGTATARMWHDLLAGCDKSPCLASTLFLISLAEEWQDLTLRIERADHRRNLWPDGLRDRMSGADVLTRRLVSLLDADGGSPFSCHLAARRALLLLDWLGGGQIEELEAAHGVPSGQLTRIAGDAAWLASAAAGVAGAARAPADVVETLEQTARLLAELSREDQDSPPGMPRTETAEPRRAGVVASPAAQEQPVPPRLVFPADNPGTVIWEGVGHLLTPLPYQLLRLLAERAGTTVKYTDIFERLWPDAAVEQQQISFHRANIEKVLFPGQKSPIRTRHRWGLVLDLPREEVELGAETGDVPMAGAAR